MAYSATKYERIDRPNYEMSAVVAWVFGGVAVFWVYLWFDLPSVVFKVMGIVCLGMTLGRGVPAVRRFFNIRKIKSGKIKEFISWEFIKEKALYKHKRVWLGKGFPWTREEIQRATDLMNRGNPQIIHQSEGRWIHGIGPRDKDLEIEPEHLTEHTLVVGTTGTGKSSLFRLMIAQAVAKGEPVIILDPKGDHQLSGCARRACELVGAPQRFLYFSPGFPDRSVRIDPLKNWLRATEPGSRVAELIPSETKTDPFQAFGWNVLDSIIQALVYWGHEPPNLLKLRRYVEGGVHSIIEMAMGKYLASNWPGTKPKETADALAKQYQELAKKKPELALDGIVRLHLHNREHFHKMVASLIPILTMLTSGSLQYLLSPTPLDGDSRPVMDLATIIEKGQVLYVGLDSMSDPTVGSAIGSILLADLTAAASARLKEMQEMDQGHIPKKDLPPVNIFVDEAAELVNDPAIQLLNKSRSAGFRLVIATQTLADLEVRTGSKAGARQVIANANNLIVFRVGDDETQKYISDSFPKTAVNALDIGYRSATRSENPVDFTGTYTEALREDSTELIPPALLGRLPNFHYFSRFGAKGTILKGKAPILTL